MLKLKKDKVYIGVVRQGGKFDKLIKWWENSEHSHAFIFRDGEKIEALLTGVKLRNFTSYSGDWIYDIYEHPAMTELENSCIWQDGLNIVKKKVNYDFKGVFHFVLWFIKQDPKAFFCSELVAYLFNLNNKRFSAEVPEEVTPEDITKSKQLIKVGSLKKGQDVRFI